MGSSFNQSLYKVVFVSLSWVKPLLKRTYRSYTPHSIPCMYWTGRDRKFSSQYGQYDIALCSLRLFVVQKASTTGSKGPVTSLNLRLEPANMQIETTSQCQVLTLGPKASRSWRKQSASHSRDSNLAGLGWKHLIDSPQIQL